jgi:hypothetical protein
LGEPTEEKMIKYLLGQLSEPETTYFEEQYFTNDEVFDRLLAVKAELIDRYVHKQLDASQTQAFEEFFLKSPNHVREVELVRALIELTQSPTTPQSAVAAQQISWMKKLFAPWPLGVRLAAGTFMTFLIGGSVWMVCDNWQLRAELNALRAEQQTALAHEQELRKRLAFLQSQILAPNQSPVPATNPPGNDAPSPRKNHDVATVLATLTPGLTRNSVPANQVQLQTETEILKLRLLLDRDFGYRSYAIALKTSGGRTIQTRSGLRVSGEAIEVEFSAGKLVPADYIVTLSGINAKNQPDELSDYAFRIVRK